MILDYFNRCGKFIEINVDTHSCRSVDGAESTSPICGIGDIAHEKTCVALVFGNVGPKLIVGDKHFDLYDASLKVMYENISGGLSRFFVECETSDAELIYASWWTTRSSQLVAYADESDDEDEDFCAYIVYLLSSPKRIKTTMDQYLGAADIF